MARQTRQRTAAQRKIKDDSEDARPLTEEEQDAEIETIKATWETNKRAAQNALDTLVVVATIVSAFHALRYLSTPSAVTLISLVQTLLLPLSLTPYWIPPLASFSQRQHTQVLGAHLSLFIYAFYKVHSAGLTGWSAYIHWALPELVAGAVEYQRRTEKTDADKIARLEALRYNHKGA
ncbi:hypothetical protein Q5752_002476 [Cryptotrichosporon argae]